MEALYEDYGDRVNFLWVYGSEAHPEEDPFAEGYESKDLGWSHPYTFTNTMEERAERALWMKTDPDPDLTLPMLVDYVGHPTQPDNAIRTAYFGYGYYSGYVIDCDGVVKVAHDWGWYGPGGEWWGLPLASEAELRVWLDAYLADPPTCYDGPTPPEPDAGVPEPDASVASDAGVAGPDAAPDGGSGNGGGCSTAGGSPALPLPLLLALFLGLLGTRLRRRF